MYSSVGCAAVPYQYRQQAAGIDAAPSRERRVGLELLWSLELSHKGIKKDCLFQAIDMENEF